MKVFVVNVETRKGDNDGDIGVYSTFEKAQEAIVKEYGDWVKTYTEFDSDFSKGEIYTEEETVLIHERELK